VFNLQKVFYSVNKNEPYGVCWRFTDISLGD